MKISDNNTLRIIHEFKELGYSTLELPKNIIEESEKLVQSFYSINPQERIKAIADTTTGILGYYPGEYEIIIYNKLTNQPVRFHTGGRKRGYSSFDFIRDDSCFIGKYPIFIRNAWPENEPTFRKRALSLYDKISQLSTDLSLSVLKKTGNSRLDNHLGNNCFCLMRLLEYKAGISERISKEHTDYELITLIISTSEGLEIKSPKGDWQPIKPIDNSAVLLPGDMLEVITKGYIESSLHRVRCNHINRQSVIYFQGLPLDFVLGYSPTNKHLPKTFGDHILSFLLRSAAHLEPNAVLLAKQMNISLQSNNPFKKGK